MYGHAFKIFAEIDVNNIFLGIKKNIGGLIKGEKENYILNVNEADYIKHLESNNLLEIPDLFFDKVYVDSYEKEIPSRHFPRSFSVRESKSYSKPVIVYHIPFSGNTSEFFQYKPSSGWIMWSTDTFIQDNALCFEIVQFYDDPEKIKKEAEEIIDKIKRNYLCLKKHCENFNQELSSFIKEGLDQIKEKHSSKSDFMAALGVPIKKKEDTPKTFSVPAPKTREKITVKPIASEKHFKPEPTLDKENYIKILKIIDDVGKNFERYPSTYKDKHEEDLRDHILLILEPNFEGGSATGETFNKSGKTDILLKYESSNVFVAECKFWNGQKKFHEAIDQLLGYLTWRESKTALIVFVKNKDFTNVLGEIDKTTKEHPNFIEFINKSSESLLNYKLHLEGDPEREIKLAIMAFHLPD